MDAIVIPQAEVRLSRQQLVAVLRQLPDDERARIWHEASQQSWEQRLDALLMRIQQRVTELDGEMTDAEIDAEVEHVRTDRHAKSGR